MQSTFLEITHQVRTVNQLEFLFWPLVLTMIIIGLVQFRSPKNIFYLFKIAENNLHLHLYLREGFNINGISSFLLQFNYFVVIGSIAYSIFHYFAKPIEINYLVLLVCYTAPLIYYLTKYIIVKIFVFLTETPQGFFEHLTNHKVFFQIQGIILLPFSILLIFSGLEAQKYLVFIIIGILILFSIFRTVLSIMYALRYGFSFLYIFMYLCTLEILPLVVILKLFDDKML
jgi:hypothetical protein